MKLNPPKQKIDEKTPFKNALFGREEFADSLTRLLRNATDNLVIFVNAPWGAGKTTFSEMWRARLKQDHQSVIYFDAYASDYFDDPFVSFTGEILGLVDERLAEGKGMIERREFKETAIEVAKRLSGLAVKIGIRAGTLGLVESAHLEELKNIGSEFAAGASEIGADIIQRKIDNYMDEKDALKKFKNSLANLASKVRQEQGFPLTIIVDELDRCRPDFALSLLERIKHLFDVEGVAFILLVNREQIESYIQTVYGNKDSRDYLLKFGSLFIELPCEQQVYPYQYENGLKEYCSSLGSHYALFNHEQGGQYLVSCTAVLSAHFSLTLREIEKVFSFMALYYASTAKNLCANPLLIALLSVLKVKLPPLYRSLKKRDTTADQFFQQTALKRMTQNRGDEFDRGWAIDMIDYCLMSDMELKLATQEGSTNMRPGVAEMFRFIGRDREQAIPRVCCRLDRFSLLPKS